MSSHTAPYAAAPESWDPKTLLDRQKDIAEAWFIQLRDQICQELENLEAEYATLNSLKTAQDLPRFQRTSWHRSDALLPEKQAGGGVMSKLVGGRVFEKVGVNVSTVWGHLTSTFAREIPGTAQSDAFWASGISLVAHPLNPYVPAIHMNTRFIVTENSWFGGGMDLTPVFLEEDDVSYFHQGLQAVCDTYDPHAYATYKAWCDRYFYLPHRQEPRGIGGIFYDDLNSGDFEKDFDFTRSVGSSFLDIYPPIVRRHMQRPWGEAERRQQMHKRGRYVEFNLLHDRGTRFGLQTNGYTEAILMSLPPVATWA